MFDNIVKGYDPGNYYRADPPSMDHPKVIKGSPGNYRRNEIYYLFESELSQPWFKRATPRDMEIRLVHP